MNKEDWHKTEYEKHVAWEERYLPILARILWGSTALFIGVAVYVLLSQ